MDATRSTTPVNVVGLPTPKKPKRSTQASILINITFLIPNRFKKNGMSKIQSVSEICEREISAVALLAPHEPVYPSNALNPVINGPAKPLVICSDIPNNMENKKKIAIFFSLNNANAFKPNASLSVLAFSVLVGQAGNVKQYNPNTMPNTAEKYHCV